MFDKIVGSIGAFSYKNRKIISIIAAIVFIAVIVVSSQLVIEYSYAEESMVTDIFPQDDTIVVVYENKDEGKIEEIISHLEKDEHITSIQAYANTLGMKMSPSEMAGMMGIPEAFVNTLFYIHENGMDTTGMTLVEFVSFISSDDFLNNEMFSSMIDDESKAQIAQMKTIVDALASEEEYSSEEIANLLGIDKQLVDSIFFIAQFKNSNIANITPQFLAYVAANILGIETETLEQVFKIFGMDDETIEQVLNVQPIESLRFAEFVDIISEISAYAGEIMDAEQLEQLGMLKDMSDMIKDEKTLSPEDLANLFASAADSEMFNENTLTLLYVLARSNTSDMSDVSIPLYDFFLFLSEDIMSNEAFSSFLDESVASQLEEAKVTMQDGLAQLVGAEHSRMVITIDYTPESKEIYAFYDNLNSMLDSFLSGKYYLVGNTAMSYEVSQSFDTEYRIISIVTALAVFVVVWFTFKKFFLSVILIGIIECAVFSMMSVMVVINLPMNFIPLILVQCILMGSMIDYGILFTTYYIEARKEYSVDKALPEVMKRATHSILTSSLLIVFVTLICGRLMSGAVASILTTLGIGSLCAIFLILFVLPSLLVIFDKHVTKQKVKKIDEFDELVQPAALAVNGVDERTLLYMREALDKIGSLERINKLVEQDVLDAINKLSAIYKRDNAEESAETAESAEPDTLNQNVATVEFIGFDKLLESTESNKVEEASEPAKAEEEVEAEKPETAEVENTEETSEPAKAEEEVEAEKSETTEVENTEETHEPVKAEEDVEAEKSETTEVENTEETSEPVKAEEEVEAEKSETIEVENTEETSEPAKVEEDVEAEKPETIAAKKLEDTIGLANFEKLHELSAFDVIEVLDKLDALDNLDTLE